MQDVTITFTAGPQNGQFVEVELGRLVVGRQPGEGGLELKGADSSVSRLHAEIAESNGKVVLQNLSPNGTRVDGSVVLDRAVLKPDTRIAIGARHEFQVRWSTVEEQLGPRRQEPKVKVAPKKGPMASPVVRAVIAVYLIGVIGLAIWLGAGGSAEEVVDDWPGILAQYEALDSVGGSAPSRAAMLARAEVLVRELRAMRIRGIGTETERICRELMSLDANRQSPLYQYGIRCLGSL